MKLQKTKKLFGLIFFVSAIIFLFLFVYLAYNDIHLLPMFIYYLTHKHFDPNQSGKMELSVIISIVSFLTSLSSLLGFISATILAWRKEDRDSRFEDLEIEKRKLEIKKLKKDLKRIDDVDNRKV
jgi:hypothetical protein